MKNQEGKRVRALRWLFPLALAYYEIVLRAFTLGGVFRVGTLLLLPFCCAFGGVGCLLTTLSKNRRVNYGVTAALLFLTAVPFAVEAFVYREFRIFYDLRAVLGGAGDVAAGFGSEVARLVFNLRGIFCVVCFLLPGILYLLFGTAPKAIGGRDRGMVLAQSAAFYVIGVLVIHALPTLSRTYGEEYSFNGAVDRFGLLTGVELDTRHALFGGDTGFEQVEMPQTLAASAPEAEAPEASTEAVPEATEEPVVDYGYNQLDLPLDDPDGKADDATRELNAYVSTLTPSKKNKYTGRFAGKNLIIITAEAFTREVIDPERTPTLYRLATKGVQFTDYYQFAGAGTSGGEYQQVFGLLPMEGIDSFKIMTRKSYNMAINQELAIRGYQGAAYHNGTSTFYDRDETHVRLGYSDGFLANGSGLEELTGSDWDTSDKDLFEKTVPTYIDRQPFSCYYMTVSAHTPYGFDNNAWAAKHRDEVEDLPYSDKVKGYLASNLELEAGLTYLINTLEEKGIADDTVICMTGDHFPYGLDDGGSSEGLPYLSELYGYQVENGFQRDHNCWILWCGDLEDEEPIVIDSPTSSLDILPTLYNLFGIDFDSRVLPGRDVFSDAPALVFTMGYDWATDLGQYIHDTDTFTPADPSATLPANYVESMKTVVRNKVRFCSGVLDTDYYGRLFWSM